MSEYFLFDPRADYLDPPLQGFRLVAGAYAPLELVDGRLHSEALGLDFVQEGHSLRFWNPHIQQWLPTWREMNALANMSRERAAASPSARILALQWAEQEKRRGDEETAARTALQQRADVAEAEIARLRAELAVLRGEMPKSNRS